MKKLGWILCAGLLALNLFVSPPEARAGGDFQKCVYGCVSGAGGDYCGETCEYGLSGCGGSCDEQDGCSYDKPAFEC